MIKKGQSILEFSLAFIIIVALILGLLSLWEWSKNNIGGRQGAFEGTRVAAGSIGSPGQPEVPYSAGAPADPYYFNR